MRGDYKLFLMVRYLEKSSSQTSNSMNKAALVEAVHQVLGSTKVQAEEVVETVFGSIIKSLSKGEEVAIAGLGKFTVKERAAREARNPKTGETVKVPKTKVPKFSAAKALKDAVK
jgi:DNA-binding protein HU-beta